jgi:hypothetical protein
MSRTIFKKRVRPYLVEAPRVSHRFNLHPLGYVLHSQLWYLVLILLMGLLVSHLVLDLNDGSLRPVSFITVIIFALAFRNGEVVIYGGVRWLLITTALGFAGLLAHLEWREQGWAPGRWLSIGFFFLALLAGEAALAIIAYVAAYELFGSPDPLKRRVNVLLPIAIMVIIYLIIYRLAGYGTAYMELYSNPFQDPVAFISGLPLKLAAMLG